MKRVRAAALFLVSLFCVCYASATPADPVITIRVGTVSIPYPTARPRIVAPGAVDLSGLFDDGAFQAEGCHPCLAGSVISLQGLLSGTALGQQYIIASNFTFAGEDLLVPQDGRTDVTLMAPFTLEGRVKLARAREPRPEDLTFSAIVVGSGTATVHLSSTVDPDTGQRLYFFRDLAYEFSPAPVQ